MEYNNFTAQTEPEVANQMDKYVEDTFQPLIEPDFDHEYFEQITQEWNNTQPALNNSQPPIQTN